MMLSSKQIAFKNRLAIVIDLQENVNIFSCSHVMKIVSVYAQYNSFISCPGENN